MTGLALTTTVGVATPAAGAGGRPATSTDDQREPKGIPVPCDADALIAAITLANARGGATLDLAKDCTYLLTADINGAGLPAITTPITLNGNKHTTIERAAATDQFRILTVNTGGNLTLNKLKLTGGNTTDAGGAILVDPGGATTVNHSTIVGNTAVSGGAITNSGTATVRQSTISGNIANTGGGIANSGALSITKSHVDSNTATNVGGGIVNTSSGSMQVTRSTVNGNRSQGSGGGLFLATSGASTLTKTEISRNTGQDSGGIFTVTGPLTLRFVTLDGNTATAGDGGGIRIIGGTTAVVEDSIITNNNAATASGGGVRNGGTLLLRRTKVAGNTANQGGGIDNGNVATLFDTKVTKNVAITDGGGIFNAGTVELNTATGTLVVGNRPNNCVNVPGCAG
nr:hypothetical protein [Salinispora fenicalii]